LSDGLVSRGLVFLLHTSLEEKVEGEGERPGKTPREIVNGGHWFSLSPSSREGGGRRKRSENQTTPDTHDHLPSTKDKRKMDGRRWSFS